MLRKQTPILPILKRFPNSSVMPLLDLQHTLGNFSFACLLAMVVWYWFKLTFSLSPSLAPVGTVGMALANLSLAGLLLARWVASGHFPLSNLYESLLFLSWGFTAFHLIMEATSRSDFIGIVASPVALLTDAFASFSLPREMQKTTALVPALQSNWLMMHVTIMMISYVALISGSLLALAFLVVNYCDKRAASPEPSLRLPGGPLALGAGPPTRTTPSMARGGQRTPAEQGPRGGARDPQLPNWDDGTPLLERWPSGPAARVGGPGSPSLSYTAQPLTSMVGNSDKNWFAAPNSDSGTEGGDASVAGPFSDTPLGSNSQAGSNRGEAISPFAQTLDNFSYRTLGLGFPLLTIGILSGAVWANEAWGSYWSWDPKETWALITWLVFAIYLHARLSKGWRGEKPAAIAVAGFFVVWICYLGVNLLGSGLHSYGWFQT